MKIFIFCRTGFTLIRMKKIIALAMICFFGNMNAHSQPNAYRPVTINESISSSLYLLNANGSTVLADGNLVEFDNSFNAGVDFYDAMKFTNINENFGLLRDGVILAIERRPIIGQQDTLFFKLTK